MQTFALVLEAKVGADTTSETGGCGLTQRVEFRRPGPSASGSRETGHCPTLDRGPAPPCSEPPRPCSPSCSRSPPPCAPKGQPTPPPLPAPRPLRPPRPTTKRP